MKNKKLEANLSMAVSKVFSGLNMNLKSATPFPKCYLQEKWTFDS